MDKLISPIPRAGAIPKAQGPLGQAAAMFFKNRGAVIGLALLVLIITASLAYITFVIMVVVIAENTA